VGVFVAVPEGGGAVVQMGDFEGGEVERVGHGVVEAMVEQADGACSVERVAWASIAAWLAKGRSAKSRFAERRLAEGGG
jgi:hypothetical protein